MKAVNVEPNKATYRHTSTLRPRQDAGHAQGRSPALALCYICEGKSSVDESIYEKV